MDAVADALDHLEALAARGPHPDEVAAEATRITAG